jgi:hypothetical protein
MSDFRETDGSPAEIAQLATNALVHETQTFFKKVESAEKLVRNAAMSEVLEVDPMAEPVELADAWTDSTENKIFREISAIGPRVVKLQQLVSQYEGYRD